MGRRIILKAKLKTTKTMSVKSACNVLNRKKYGAFGFLTTARNKTKNRSKPPNPKGTALSSWIMGIAGMISGLSNGY